MSIFSISTPSAYQVKTAYNPLVITALSTGVNPVTYVDVYMSGIYYKTISTTTPSGTIVGFKVWTVDIRDAVEEFLRSTPPLLSGTPLAPQLINDGYAMCTVKVRGSTINGSGYLVPDGPVPVQATMDNAAVAGGGITPSGALSWAVLNGALQLPQKPDVEATLAANNVGFVQPGGYQMFNLWTNPALSAAKDDFLHLPLLIPYFGLSPAAGLPTVVTSENFYLVIEDQAGTYYYPTDPGHTVYATYAAYVSNNVYYLPAGPKNFAGIGAAGTAPPDWSTITKYRMVLTNSTIAGAGIRWKSPWIQVYKACDNLKRFRFVNWYGHFDTIVFDEHAVDFKTTSEGWEQYNLGDFLGTGKERFGKRRYNVRATDTFTVNGYFDEAYQPFLKQFLSSPTAYIETKGTAGQADYMTPIRILDATVQTRKIDERYMYIVTIQAELANEYITIRN